MTAGIDLSALRRGTVKYRIVKPLKKKLLERAFAAFRARAQIDPQVEAAFAAFCETEKSWLVDYTLFRVLMERNAERETWDAWGPEHSDIDAARRWLDSLGEEERVTLEERRDFYSYVQWIALQQWRDVKAYAEAQGVALMGDIPFGVSYYSADVFAHPDRVCARLVRRRAARAIFQGRRIHPKVGPKLGHPALSLGRDAEPTTSIGGGSASTGCGRFFISSGSIMCSDFTASMPFPGVRGATPSFCP